MENEQTAKQTPAAADAERLKELFEYEMTQVRAGFRKELLQLNAEKMENAGKDVAVPVIQTVETPACQTVPITPEYTCPDISARMAAAVPEGSAEKQVVISGVQMPELSDISKPKAAEAAVTVPGMPELPLPAAARLDAVRQAGGYRCVSDAGSISAALEKELDRDALHGALSALETPALQGTAEITLPERSDVSLDAPAMDRLKVWEGAQPAVPEKTDVTVPVLEPQHYETKDIQPEMPGDIVTPDTGMSKIAGWDPAELPEIRTGVESPAFPDAGGLSQTPSLPLPEKTSAVMPEVPEKQAFSVPQIGISPEAVTVPAAGIASVQNWQPAEPQPEQISEEVDRINAVKAPEMPVPPVITVKNSAEIVLPKPIKPQSIPSADGTADAAQIAAAAPVLPEIPGVHITGAAVSGEITPQSAGFGQIQTGMQQVLADAARAVAEKNTLMAGLLQTANG